MGKKIIKTFVIGGHATPAYAVIDEIRNRDLPYEIYWVGEKHNQRGAKNLSAEYSTVTDKYHFPFIEMTAGKISRFWDAESIVKSTKDLFKILVGFTRALFIIAKYRPDLTISFGGYLAVPIVFWAKMFGSITVTHEQTQKSGLANKVISKFSDKVFVSFEKSFEDMPKHKTVLTGNPIRKNLFEVNSNTLTKSFDSDLPTIYVTPGNQSSHTVNKLVFDNLDKILTIANLIHQTGKSSLTQDYERAEALQKTLSPERASRYVIRDYVGPQEIGEAFNKSDIIVGRGGVNTALEILALGKYALIIPIPNTSNNEQDENGKLVASTGLGICLTQDKSLTAEVFMGSLAKLVQLSREEKGINGEPVEQARNAAKKYAHFDAASKFVDHLELLRGKVEN